MDPFTDGLCDCTDVAERAVSACVAHHTDVLVFAVVVMYLMMCVMSYQYQRKHPDLRTDIIYNLIITGMMVLAVVVYV